MPTVETIWSFWALDSLVISGLLLSSLLYGTAVYTLRRRTASSRGVTIAHVAAFTVGLLVIALALMSPLEPLSAMLFSAHMGQHLALMLVAAPFMVLGTPAAVLAWLLPHPHWRRKLGRWWHQHAYSQSALWPWVIAFVYALNLWLWHLPTLYEAALRLRLVHILEHTLFFSTALLFWWVVLRQSLNRYGSGLLIIFSTAVQGGLLAALITFSPRPWYPLHAAVTASWGLTPLQDQQLAGALMWVPAGIIYVAAAVYLLTNWFQHMEKRDGHRSAYVE